MIQDLSQALSSLGAASAAAKRILESGDAATLTGPVLELQQAIITTQQHVLAGQVESAKLATRVAELEQECLRLRVWGAETQRYIRREVGFGVFVHIDKTITQDFENAPKLCSVCFEKAIKSLLLQQIVNPGRMINLICPNGCPPLIFTHYLVPAQASVPQQGGGQKAA
jgi:hypothetical protein